MFMLTLNSITIITFNCDNFNSILQSIQTKIQAHLGKKKFLMHTFKGTSK